MSKNNNRIHPLIKIKNILLEDINYRLYKLEMEQKKIINSNEQNKLDDKSIKEIIHFEFEKGQYVTKKELKRVVYSFLSIVVVLNLLLLLFINYKINVKSMINRTNIVRFDSELDDVYNFLLDKKLPVIKDKNNIIINSSLFDKVMYIFLWSYKLKNDYSFLSFKSVNFSRMNKEQFRVISEFYPVLLDYFNKMSDNETIFYFEGIYDSFPFFLEDILRKIIANNIVIHYKKIRLPDIYFGKSSFDLLDNEIEKLKKVVYYMVNIPSLNIKIIGHADKSGDDRLNINLSCKRAIEVEKFLIKNGISATRLKTECFSSFKAKSDNPVENRKVEFKFLF